MECKANARQIDAPAVVVRDPAEARQVVEVARRLGRPVLLLTEPGAHVWLGPPYLLEMMRQAGADGDAIGALIDCGRDAGSAMQALRVGWRELHMTGNPDTVRRVAEMTAAAGGRFHECLPAALTLDGSVPVDERLERWLTADRSNCK